MGKRSSAAEEEEEEKSESEGGGKGQPAAAAAAASESSAVLKDGMPEASFQRLLPRFSCFYATPLVLLRRPNPIAAKRNSSKAKAHCSAAVWLLNNHLVRPPLLPCLALL